MSDVPGYHPLRTLGKLSSACRKLELIEWEMKTLDSSKVEKSIENVEITVYQMRSQSVL